jgi:alkane 1-monooxygenase
MKSRAVKNAGYLLALAPQIILVLGVYTGFAWLSVLFFFVFLPVVRKFVGNDLSVPNTAPSAFLAGYLRAVPRLYFVTWAIVLPWSIWILSVKPMTVAEYIGFALGLWIVNSLNTAIGHELIHSRSRFDRALGGILNASAGYFHFPEEHLSHHERTGHYHGGDAAVPGTSIYAYAAGRYFRYLRVAWEFETARLKRNKSIWLANRLLRRALVPILIGAAYCYFAGVTGLVIYLFQVVGASFSVQAITYLQHWGLSEKETPELRDFGFSWEDGCWMQACVTLNHAFHGQHHLTLARPYYELGTAKGGLLLPASYPVMFVLALFPQFFSGIMQARLEAWLKDFEDREMQEHSSDCIGTTMIAQALSRGQASLSAVVENSH